jgi:hypothetical protein
MPADRLSVGQYEQDFDAWAMHQAGALRAVGGAIADGGLNRVLLGDT